MSIKIQGPQDCEPEESTPGAPITDKAGYARRWMFSRRHVDTLISQGLPHLAIGKRRVRICVDEADRWMREKYGVKKKAPPKTKHCDPKEAA